MSMSVVDKINAGSYHPKVPYPTKPIALTAAAAESFMKVRQYEDAMKSYRASENAYRKAEAECRKQFQYDLEEQYRLRNHPKADLLWSKAWDLGHAYGLMEVAGIYDDLAELLSPTVDTSDPDDRMRENDIYTRRRETGI